MRKLTKNSQKFFSIHFLRWNTEMNSPEPGIIAFSFLELAPINDLSLSPRVIWVVVCCRWWARKESAETQTTLPPFSKWRQWTSWKVVRCTQIVTKCVILIKFFSPICWLNVNVRIAYFAYVSVLKETLENRGVLGQIRARVRAEVFGALDDQVNEVCTYCCFEYPCVPCVSS